MKLEWTTIENVGTNVVDVVVPTYEVLPITEAIQATVLDFFVNAHVVVQSKEDIRQNVLEDYVETSKAPSDDATIGPILLVLQDMVVENVAERIVPVRIKVLNLIGTAFPNVETSNFVGKEDFVTILVFVVTFIVVKSNAVGFVAKLDFPNIEVGKGRHGSIPEIIENFPKAFLVFIIVEI